MKFFNLKNLNFKIFLILFLAAVFRFIGLAWGFPFHFHPDEWNMAAAITRLSFENKFNPQFFAYGQFPLYLSYFSAQIYKTISLVKASSVTTQEAIFFLRFWSALFGIGSVYFVYLISRQFFSANYALFAALLAAFTPGLIQISHFGTTESILSFCFLSVVYYSIKIFKKPSFKNYFLSAVFLGIALASKITALVFITPLFLTNIILFARKNDLKQKLTIVFFSASSFVLTLILTLLTSPYLLLKKNESLGTLIYEKQVAAGEIPVFYTRQFFNTTPIFFQLEKIFPYALGWPIFILGSLGLFFILAFLIKKLIKKQALAIYHWLFIVILVSFLTYFFSQAFLFTKWTRFMAPIFAFFPIFFVFPFNYFKSLKYLKYTVILSALPGVIFSLIYFHQDVRFRASLWIVKNIPSGSKVLSETGNVVDIPILPPNYSNLPDYFNYLLNPISFDFYHLDEDPQLFTQLINFLENSDYIFIPSRRIFKNHQRLADKFPLTAKYYDLLFSGKLGFEEIKKFSSFDCSFSSICSLLNDEQAEETWSVFDHPVVRIYKKTVKLTVDDYEKLFKIQ